ncbi:diguanylate cyclase domain-containing protein [Blastococcus sp. SYSU D00820]
METDPSAVRPAAAEPRETSGAVLAALLEHVRVRGGEAAVDAVLARAGLSGRGAELADRSAWWSYASRIRMYEAATEVLGDPDTMYTLGATAMRSGMGHSLVLVLRALGSPRSVYRHFPRAISKFTTVQTVEVLELRPTSATLAMTLAPGHRHSELDCRYAHGLATTVPEIFGLPAGRFAEATCGTGDGPTCVYRVTWQRRRRGRRHRNATGAAEAELTALRGQLRTLQSAAGDLVAGEDLDEVLQRVVVRASEAVFAPAHLLAVADPEGGPPLLRGNGLRPEEIQRLGTALLRGEDLGSSAVVVEIASARRRHGRLAALNATGGDLADEPAMLAAYAGHAAAALDLLVALSEARRQARRAGELLGLAHELAAAADAGTVCALVAGALPAIVGCDRARVLLWDPAAGALRSADASGPAADDEPPLRASDLPDLVRLMTDRQPQVLHVGSVAPEVRARLEAAGVTDAIVVPLVAEEQFLGIAVVSWPAGRTPPDLEGEVLVRLLGVADQAATALQKARLLETVRHQATHDALTGLPNRVLFRDRLETALAAAGPGRSVGVLFCDLDGFKAVNDSMGHAAGDELLRRVAARLRAAIRPGDTVGRLSGDEFAVLLPALAAPADAGAVVTRVQGCFADPFVLDRREVPVTTSVGVAVHTGGAGSADELLGAADAAMYRHKHRRRDGSPRSEDAPAG